MGNCKAKDHHDSVEETFTIVTDDQKEYRIFHSEVVQRFLANNFEIVDTTFQNNLYGKISHCGLGINKSHIDDTIKSYVDYMIIWAFKKSRGQNFDILPPFNIEMCLRIHILYSAHFKNFLNLLSGPNNEFKFEYEPKKMVSSGDLDLKQKYAKAYNECLAILGKGHCFFIWGNPQRSFLKNEFSFCFTSPERKLEFNNFHMNNYNVSKMRSFDPVDILSFANNYRRRSGLDNISEVKNTPLPILSDKFVWNPEPEHIEVARKIDEFKFPEHFISTLLWEQMIGVEEAMKWMLEYKKFLFLLFIEGKKTIISPSEKVDQVWHLHLQHYQNYNDTVGSIRFINHGPSKGGREEYVKYSKLYDDTVGFLNKYFGTLDTECWPDNGQGRYGEQGEYLAFIPIIKKTLWGEIYQKAKKDHENKLMNKKDGKKKSKQEENIRYRKVSIEVSMEE